MNIELILIVLTYLLIAILFHELGHIFMIRFFNYDFEIKLCSFGIGIDYYYPKTKIGKLQAQMVLLFGIFFGYIGIAMIRDIKIQIIVSILYLIGCGSDLNKIRKLNGG